LITQNIIHGNNWENLEFGGGISIELPQGSTGSPEIRLNNIWQNKGYGIRILGREVNSNTVVTQNSITENEPFQARIGDTLGNITMSRNWWGTTDSELIEDTLYDGSFEFRLKEIKFLPRLNGPPEGVPVLEE